MTPSADMEATASIDTRVLVAGDTRVTPLADMELITLALKESSVHTNQGFLRGAIDCFVLIKFANHVALRLWKGEVYICYVELDFIYY